MEALIKQGTKDRLRAVLLTATAAALGFLPMAISTNVGAEVQRPLATVVIGGLVTATLLTLVVLPVLYSIFNSPRNGKPIKLSKTSTLIPLLLIGLFLSPMVNAQEKPLTLQELIPLALKNNSGLKASELTVQQSDALISSAFDFGKTQIYYHYDQNNLTAGNLPLNVYGIQQDFLFPTVYFAGRRVNKASYDLMSSAHKIRKKALEREVTESYYHYLYAKKKEQIYVQLDSLYQNFSKMAQRRFELGETNYLEKLTASSKQRKIQISLEQANQDLDMAHTELLKKVQPPDSITIAIMPMDKISLTPSAPSESVEINYYQNSTNLANVKRKYETQKLLPDISLNYFQGTNSALSGNLHGYQLGLKIPLLFGANTSRIKATKIAEKIALERSKDYEIQLYAHYAELQTQYLKYNKALEYYEQEGTALSNELLKMANLSFKNGEIDFFQYIQSLENAYEIKLDYLNNLDRYNQTVINLNYLTL